MQHCARKSHKPATTAAATASETFHAPTLRLCPPLSSPITPQLERSMFIVRCSVFDVVAPPPQLPQLPPVKPASTLAFPVPLPLTPDFNPVAAPNPFAFNRFNGLPALQSPPRPRPHPTLVNRKSGKGSNWRFFLERCGPNSNLQIDPFILHRSLLKCLPDKRHIMRPARDEHSVAGNQKLPVIHPLRHLPKATRQLSALHIVCHRPIHLNHNISHIS